MIIGLMEIPEIVVRTICLELCDGVQGAKPDHPRLRRDVENMLLSVQRSATLRTIVVSLDHVAKGVKS